MFVVTTYHTDQSAYHPEVRFFRNVDLAKEVAHRFMSDFDEEGWEIEEGPDGLEAYNDGSEGEVSVRPIKFEDDGGV